MKPYAWRVWHASAASALTLSSGLCLVVNEALDSFAHAPGCNVIPLLPATGTLIAQPTGAFGVLIRLIADFWRRGDMKLFVQWKDPYRLISLALLLTLCGLGFGCVTNHATVMPQPQVMDTGWTARAVGLQELEELTDGDLNLSPQACLDILARLNLKSRFYIQEDIKRQKVLKVPNNFHAYVTWTPLPRRIARITSEPKFILVAKDIPFLGWYEKGRLAGDSYVCIGKKPEWTRAGLYRVKEKVIDQVSSSYRNASGDPALMPYAMRIYGQVWIHGGDITGGYCSHGCINLPLDAAAELFKWAAPGTMVLVVDSLQNLDQALAKHPEFLSLSRSAT